MNELNASKNYVPNKIRNYISRILVNTHTYPNNIIKQIQIEIIHFIYKNPLV